ncbi:MAG: hypothetical protein ACRDRT_07260, partial [Pseudonocardiaceae bacterium]
PKLSFVEIARTFGVGGAVVSDATVLRAELEKGLKVVESGRPYVVEVLTDPAVTADAPLPRLDVLFASQRGGDDQFGWQARQLGPS